MDKCLENKRKEEVRLNKYISDTGFCSRREADKLIEENRVKVDGIKATIFPFIFFSVVHVIPLGLFNAI